MVLRLILFVCALGATKAGVVKRADDTNPLEAVVQQLTQRIASLESELATVKNSVAANSGQLQKAVAFTASFSAAAVTLAPHGPLRFDDVRTNIGNGYNAHSGIFTAPYPGVYVFLLTVTSQHHHWIQVAIDKNGTAVAVAHADNNEDTWDKGTIQVTLHLKAGEEVWARHNAGDLPIYGSWFTSLSGFLVHAD